MIRTALLILACSSAPCLAQAAGQGVSRSEKTEPAAPAAEPLDLAALLSSRHVGIESADQTAARIVALGSSALPESLLSLAEGHLRDASDRRLPLSASQRSALEVAARRFGRASVCAWGQELLTLPEDAAQRRAALAGLAEVGTSQDIVLALALAKLADGQSANAQRVADSLGRATAAILRRDERALEVVLARVLDLEEMRAQPLLAALSGLRNWRAAHALFGLIAKSPAELRSLTLSHAANVAPWAHHPVDGHVLREARSGIKGRDEGLLRSSLAAVAAMQDFESAEALIEIMEGDVPGRARMAELALREMTSLSLGAAAKPWRTWLERERKWYQQRYPKAVEELESPSPTVVLQAVREIGSYRYQRQELGLALGTVLRRREPHLRSSTCRVLKALGSVAPRSELLECLGDPNTEVSAAALECLMAVTGFKAPADVEEWALLLGESR